MREILGLAKAMADGNRLRILTALADGELCVCQLIELLGLAPSTVSKHLSILYRAGLVEARKEGRWMYYRWAGRKAPKAVKEAHAWLQRHLANCPEMLEDRRALQKILGMDREVLCKKQNRN